MKQNKKKKKENIGTFDIETDPFKKGRAVLSPFCADFYDGKNHYTFWGDDCIAKCAQIMLQFRGIIYAHNGGKFDFHFLLPHLFNDPKLFCINNRIASIKSGEAEFRDSFCIIPVGLAKFGSKIEFDYTWLEKENRDSHKREILEYLRQDTRGLYDGVKGFIELYGNSLTLATTAFKQLKTFGIKPVTYRDEFNDIRFRPFYFGGRCEVFKSGLTEGDLTYIDINSAYPRAMMENHCFSKSWMKGNSIKMHVNKLKRSFIRFIGISNGVLPMRKKDGGIFFPSDKQEREYFASGWEFESGLRRGKIEIKRIIEVWTPNETKNFAEYVNHFFALKAKAKEEGDAKTELFAKLMLNSSYGKFALNPNKFKDVCLVDIGEEPEGENWTFVKNLDEAGFSIFEKPSEKEKSWYNVATAASVTGWVRAFLSESLDDVENPLYCDTDSIICFNTGNLKLGDKLGEWKIEANGKRVYIGGKKIYAFEENSGKWKKASKGAKLSIDEIKKVCLGEVVKWESEAPNFTIKKSSVTFVTRNIKLTSNK